MSLLKRMIKKLHLVRSQINRILFYKIVTFLIIVSTIYNYFHTINKYSVNFPLADDYDAILVFLNSWEENNSKISLLFSQHNEHRLGFLRVIVWLYYKMFSSINFTNLILLGNSLQILLLVIFYKSTNDKRKFILIFPIFFLILNSSHWETQSWAMGSLSVYSVLVFAFFSLYLINKAETSYFILGIFFAFLSTYSQANGIFVFISGIILLLKNKSRLILWLVSGMVVVFIYFYLFPYQRVVHHPMILFKLDKVFLINRFFYGLTLLSSVFHSKFILVLGVIPLVLIFYIFKNFLLFSRLHIAMLLFLLISFGSLTISRDGFGYEQAFSSRYQFNTVVLYSVIYLAFLPFIKVKKHLFLILLFSGMFYLNSNIYNMNNFFTRKNEILEDKICKDKCSKYKTYPNDIHAANVLSTSMTKGIFISSGK